MKTKTWVLQFLFFLFGILGACAPSAEGEKDAMVYNYDDEGLRNDGGAKKPRYGWSAAGQLGFLNPNLEVSLQAQFEEPGTYTVTFNVDYPRTGPDEPVAAEAVIEWSVAGNTVQRIVSISDGASVTGTAEAVRVTLRDTSPIGDNTNLGYDTRYNVSIQVARGTRGSFTNPPILTRLFNSGGVTYLDAVAGANGTRTYPVPENAGVTAFKVLFANVTYTPITDNDITVEQLDPSNNVLSQCDPRNNEWTPLVPGAISVVFRNNSGAGVYPSMIWAIDG